jgi:hypothetical protein
MFAWQELELSRMCASGIVRVAYALQVLFDRRVLVSPTCVKLSWSEEELFLILLGANGSAKYTG